MPLTKSPSQWVSTDQFAAHLGIHPQTVRAIRKAPTSPWVAGVHYRQTGVNGRYFQWRQAEAETAFNSMRRTPVGRLETFQREPNPRAN